MASLSFILFGSKQSIFLSFLCKCYLQFRSTTMIFRFCFLITLCSLLEFYKAILPFWSFPVFCDMLVLFVVLKFSGNGYCKYRKGLSLIFSNADHYDGVNSLRLKSASRVSGAGGGDPKMDEIDELMKTNCGFVREKGVDVLGSEGEEESCDEEKVFDVMSLRNMVKFQRRRADAAELELEKERMAAASSADEALAMILRLQNDKSALQIQVNQLQRWTEEKELYDEAMIQSLEGIITDHEHERSLLVERLRVCREKLRPFVKDEEWDEDELDESKWC